MKTRLPRTGRRRCSSSGQATVEFAIIVPLVVMVMLLIAQVVVIAYVQLTVNHLAREIARELVVDPTADIGRLAADRSPLGQDGLSIETQIVSAPANGRATIVVRVTHNAVSISRVFHPFLADVTLSAEVSMVIES